MSMNSDNFEFEKACTPQSLEDNTPYKSKTFSYINDINSGVSRKLYDVAVAASNSYSSKFDRVISDEKGKIA